MILDSGQQQTMTPAKDLIDRAAVQIGRAAGHLRQLVCGLSGHDELLHFGKGRLSLHCASCGYETPGWDLKPAPDRPGTAPRGVRTPLFGERRAA